MFNWYFASGDLGFFWKEQIRAFSWLPQVFYKDQGFGFNGLLSLWVDYPFRLVVKLLSTFGLSWFFIEKLLWLSVFVIAAYSSYKLAKNLLAPVIYVANTYFLLLVSGGQLGVALAFALTPLVLVKFMKDRPIANGLWMALLVAFDLRIAYLVSAAIVFYLLLEKKYSSLYFFVASLLVAASVHLYWILPTILASRGTASLGEQFTNPGMLKFLSFADFSHTLGLLHPNWPENLFGKMNFLQPEFLIIPILAFSALLFRDKKTRFFALLALIGVFLAKGVNEPFGAIFQWMFERVPGFVMFRDPTKFYLYIAIGYSVLIPTVLRKLNKKLVYVLFILFWLLTLRGFQVRAMQLPQEYIRLKNILVSDAIPSRTLWIPAKENFAYFSDIHPLLTSTTSSSIDPSIKYIIVPIDLGKKIFLNDYHFDPTAREKVIAGIHSPRDPRFNDLAVFENPSFSGMHIEIQPIVASQQKLANIGLGVSVAFLLGWLAWLYFTHS